MFKRISALSRGFLKRKKGKDTIHFNRGSSNTELLNQLSINGAVANWCEQFGLTEEEKERQKRRSLNKVNWKAWRKSHEVKLLVCPPKMASGNSLQEHIFELRSSVRQNSVLRAMWRRLAWTSRISRDDVKNSTWPGRRLWATCSIMSRIHTFSTKPSILSLCSNSWENSHWTSYWSSDRENYWPIWT